LTAILAALPVSIRIIRHYSKARGIWYTWGTPTSAGDAGTFEDAVQQALTATIKAPGSQSQNEPEPPPTWATRAPFTVTFWESTEAAEPLATVQMAAKMPLGALVFAMQQEQISRAGYVLVSHEQEQAEFYNVWLDKAKIHYDRAVLPNEKRKG
jgi:hypothetical protein